MILALGVADALGLPAVVRVGPYYSNGIAMAVLLVTGGYLLLDHRGRRLHRVLAQAAPSVAQVEVRGHLNLAKDALLILAVCGAMNGLFVLLLAHGVLGPGSIPAIRPGGSIAQGVLEISHAGQARAWERDHDSELLIGSSWRRPTDRGVFLLASNRS